MARWKDNFQEWDNLKLSPKLSETGKGLERRPKINFSKSTLKEEGLNISKVGRVHWAKIRVRAKVKVRAKIRREKAHQELVGVNYSQEKELLTVPQQWWLNHQLWLQKCQDKKKNPKTPVLKQKCLRKRRNPRKENHQISKERRVSHSGHTTLQIKFKEDNLEKKEEKWKKIQRIFSFINITLKG